MKPGLKKKTFLTLLAFCLIGLKNVYASPFGGGSKYTLPTKTYSETGQTGMRNSSKDECPNKKVYGDQKNSTYIEFHDGDKMRKIYFSDVIVNVSYQRNTTSYAIDFPKFGYNPYYHKFNDKIKSKKEFRKRLKNTLNGMMELELNLDTGYNEGVNISGLENGYKDCIEKKKTEEKRRSRRAARRAKRSGEGKDRFDFSIFGGARYESDKIDVAKENGTLKIQIEASFSSDSTKWIKANIETNQHFKGREYEMNLVEKQPLLEKALGYTQKKEKVNIVHMTHRKWWNETNIIKSKRGRRGRTIEIPRPDDGQSVVAQEERYGFKVYEYIRSQKGQVIIREFSPGRAEDHRDYNKEGRHFYITTPDPRFPLDKDPKELIENKEPDQVYINRSSVRQVKLRPVFFKPSPHPESVKEHFELEFDTELSGYKSISPESNKNIGKPYEGRIYWDGRYTKRIKALNNGYQIELIGSDIISEIKLARKKVKGQASKKVYRSLMKLSKKWPEKRRDVIRGKMTADEALNWGVKQAKRADIPVENKKDLTVEDFERQVYKEDHATQFGLTPEDLILLDRVEYIKKMRRLPRELMEEFDSLEGEFEKIKNEYPRKERDKAEIAMLKAYIEEIRPILKRYGLQVPEGYQREDLKEERGGPGSPDIRKLNNNIEDQVRKIYGRTIEDESFGRGKAPAPANDKTSRKIRVDEEGYPVFRSFVDTRIDSQRMVYGKGQLHYRGGKSGYGQDSLTLDVNGRFIDVHQFESVASTLPYDKKFRTTLFFAGTDLSQSGGTAGNGTYSAYQLRPEFLKARFKVQEEAQVQRFGKTIKAYKVKAFIKGDVEVLPFFRHDNELKYDFRSGDGYFTLYVKKAAPHHLMRIELDDKTLKYYQL